MRWIVPIVEEEIVVGSWSLVRRREGEDHAGDPHPVVRIDRDGLGDAAGFLWFRCATFLLSGEEVRVIRRLELRDQLIGGRGLHVHRDISIGGEFVGGDYRGGRRSPED